MTCFRRGLISLSILALLSSSSCGPLKRTQVKSTIDEAHRELQLGDFQKALDTYQLAHKKYPKDSEMLRNYVETIESVKVQGDIAFDTKNFLQAQMTYDLLVKNFVRFSELAHLLSFKEDFLVTRLKMSQMLQAEKQAQFFIKRGDLQKGIDIYRGLFQQYPSDTTVRNRYISLLESIKGQADLDFKRKDFASAGRAYRILLRNYSSLSYPKRSLSYNPKLLDTGLEICRKVLFDDGLDYYRSGDLSQAISIWRNILTFDPENPEVKKVTDQAILQYEYLKRINLDNTQ